MCCGKEVVVFIFILLIYVLVKFSLLRIVLDIIFWKDVGVVFILKGIMRNLNNFFVVMNVDFLIVEVFRGIC